MTIYNGASIKYTITTTKDGKTSTKEFIELLALRNYCTGRFIFDTTFVISQDLDDYLFDLNKNIEQYDAVDIKVNFVDKDNIAIPFETLNYRTYGEEPKCLHLI